MAVPPTPPSSADRLGVIAGDNGGYPNRRRVADDTVDIALRVDAGVLVDGFNVSPNSALGDGVDGPDVPYLASLPYLAPPHSGFDRIHANSAQLQGGRFSATVSWTGPNGNTGAGTPVGVAGNTEGFWFFTPDNIELTVKVLDGRNLNGHFWVF